MTFCATRRALLRAGIALAGGAAIKLPAYGGTPKHSLPLVGVNLASAEFGLVPGRYGQDYIYPSSKDVDHFARLGFNCLRIPFLWERLQPNLNARFDPKEKARLQALVSDITRKGLTAVIDPHNYARRRVRDDGWSQEHLIGSPEVPTESFLDFWRRLAEMFKDNDGVIFGLMNEPYDISAAQWLAVANRAIGAIRSTGAGNLIAIPGTQWSGAHSWRRSGNTALEGVIDPFDRYVIEVHQYFDEDSSGKSPVAVSGSCGSERLRDFQAWARQKGVKAFLGEFGGADNAASRNALADICQEMSANSDVWLGWTAWAAGPMWSDDYIFNLGPDANGGLRPQTRILAEHARPLTPGYWTKPGAVIDLDLARERTYGCPDPTAVLAFREHRYPRSSQPGTMRVRGPLLAVMQAPEFTLLVETEGLHGTIRELDIVATEGGVLLQRTQGGSLGTTIVGKWNTTALPLSAWAQRRRCAFAASRARSRIALGVTGTKLQWRDAVLPSFFSVTISAGPGAGRIVRVTAFDRCIDGEALDSLLA